MGLKRTIDLRVRREWHRLRAWRRLADLKGVANRTGRIQRGDILLFCTLRNERIRLPYFFDYYRRMGVNHFLFVDNGSDDGTRDYLVRQEDASVWTTTASYRRAHFGVDWLNGLQGRFGHNHWCLTVDADEFLVYPFCDTRPLRALTDWLQSCSIRSMSAMMLDMYPKGSIGAKPYHEGQNPFEIAEWFDPGNYQISRNGQYGNVWIQGGPRGRAFFGDAPYSAPALNKIPLVRWNRRYAYISSTHMMLPRGLNSTYDRWGGEQVSGCLMHAKFIDTFGAKAQEEMRRGEHYAQSREYAAYRERIEAEPDLWTRWSERYVNWRQLEILGLISKGNWA
ncbi:glycosyltransferase family 2 protein [Falsirhodobacter halotolerans]|uniref:glycosyltransferase family 2 protein n=1 Tax=Falsirhodobacter halotolerans TaxID=1146892 RepID=UPI001FCF7FCF|nr:glycosyltransferase family 2 protein [Falsirhodobacter halotolerans]MCJ8138362.1 glycosyltransferase family 2 protein [Falsirhodobacter halotolerans]